MEKVALKPEPLGSAYITSIKDGKLIYTRIWKPTTKPVAVVLAFHGLGEHINRYDHVYQTFADKGILVKGMDTRGHGRTVLKNNAIKGHHDGLDFVFEDMMQLYDRPVDPFGDLKALPHFVMGHSKGGFLALMFSKEVASQRVFNFQGTIAQAPMLRTPIALPYLLQTAVWALGSTFLGNVTQPNNIDGRNICSSEEVVVDYATDPLNHGVASLKMAKDLIFGGEALLKDAQNYTTPVCMYFAKDDKLTSSAAGKEFIEKCGSTDKVYKEFEGDVRHEIHNEPSIQDQIIAEYVDWILKRSTDSNMVDR